MARMTKQQQRKFQSLKIDLDYYKGRVQDMQMSRDRAYQANIDEQKRLSDYYEGVLTKRDQVIEEVRKNLDIALANQRAEEARADDNLQRSIETAVKTAISTTAQVTAPPMYAVSSAPAAPVYEPQPYRTPRY